MNFPKYVCHKEVSAAVIVDIVKSESSNEKFLHVKAYLIDSHVTVVTTNEPAMMDKAVIGDYYVVYSNGFYNSVSPKMVFEEGYTILPEVADRAL